LRLTQTLSYVFYLESRVSYLESLLQANGIPFNPPEDFASTSRAKNTGASLNNGGAYKRPVLDATSGTEVIVHDDRNKVDKLLSHASRVAVQGASDSRFLGSTSGISFARVVFAAVKSSVSGAPSERGGVRPSKPLGTSSSSGTSMRDSFFGLHTKPTIKPAQFPSKELGLKLVGLYFEHANPQIPILHRPEFMATFENAYASDERSRTARESYMLNIVFAIGAGTIVGKPSEEENQTDQGGSSSTETPDSEPSQKRRKIVEEQCQPEEYHASAIVHLESFLASSAALERPDGIGGSLEELQAVLLLAGFALLRPVAPGLWYIVGVALRLGVDLGLHSEDWSDSDRNLSEDHRNPEGDLLAEPNGTLKSKNEKGRRQYICDFRRRLWWCVYSFDRLVSTCVGRPFGITDQVITTEFPTLLNDKYITPKGFLISPAAAEKPSYKLVAYHYFRLRLLQSEILQVLQHRQASQARERGVNQDNPYMHTHLPSPFLKNFDYSFRLWRQDIDRRLWEWKESAPTQQDAGVQFSPLFLELNYWQAIIMLYRQSLTVPAVLAEELRATNEDIQSPSMVQIEEREDEETVFLKVAEAGQKVLKLYRQLHRIHLVNYTFLATHHLFMAGKAHN
jgi:Fungal specific transcription factor domain